jgi:hypothetical protein
MPHFPNHVEKFFMQKAFSSPSMCFASIPDDSQLVCLLGDPNCGPIQAVEEAGILTARPWRIPMKFMVPWVILTLLLISILAVYFYHPRDIFLWLFLAFGWFICLPGLLGLLAVFNRMAAKQGDYFKVDTERRTLELCQVDRTIKANEIIAITLLTRWYRYQFVDGRGAWNKTYQTGVLVRTQDNRVELHPVVRENRENVPSSKKSKWADRLANIFQVPIRQIELTRSESLALNDC